MAMGTDSRSPLPRTPRLNMRDTSQMGTDSRLPLPRTRPRRVFKTSLPCNGTPNARARPGGWVRGIWACFTSRFQFPCSGGSPTPRRTIGARQHFQNPVAYTVIHIDICTDIFWVLADAFGTSPEFWSNLQTGHDLSLHRPKMHVGPLVSVES